MAVGGTGPVGYALERAGAVVERLGRDILQIKMLIQGLEIIRVQTGVRTGKEYRLP